jgi:hypothetical protein
MAHLRMHLSVTRPSNGVGLPNISPFHNPTLSWVHPQLRSSKIIMAFMYLPACTGFWPVVHEHTYSNHTLHYARMNQGLKFLMFVWLWSWEVSGSSLRASLPVLSMWPCTGILGWGTSTVKSSEFTGRLLWPWKNAQLSYPRRSSEVV